MPDRYQWSLLNKQQVGAYTEYFVKMEFTMYGFQVYKTEVDDRGIDFVTRHEDGPFLRVQVKAIRDNGYVFLEKEKFKLDENLYLALGILSDGKLPSLYLVPSTIWRTPNALLVDRKYEGLQSKPEWGLNLSTKNLALLKSYDFAIAVEGLMDSKPA